MNDFRQAIRLFSRRPLLALVAVVALATGLGAAIAAFAVVDQLLLREPPLPDPSRVVMVNGSHRDDPAAPRLVTPREFHDWQAARVFEAAGAWMRWNFNLTGVGAPERLRGVLATDGFFPALGRSAQIGRTLRAGDPSDQVVISHALWQRAFRGDAGIVGRSVTLGGESATIVGVMPADFVYPDEETDLWTLYAFEPDEGRNLRVYARLHASMSLDATNARLRSIPSSQEGWTANAVRLHEQQTRELRPMLVLVFAAAAAMLIIACANVANLLLMLAASRERELATRIALGARPARLARQMMLEACLLGAVAGVLATLLAGFVLRVAAHVQPTLHVTLDIRAIVAGFLAAFVAAIVASLAPAVLATRRAHAPRDARVIAPGGRLRSGLVIAQMALTSVLLVCGGVLVKSFQHLVSVDPGFDARNVLTARLSLPESYATSAEQARFFERMTERIAALPGVVSAATIQDLPLRRNAMTFDISLDGARASKGAYRVVSDRYFATMRIPVVRGRGFTRRDDAQAPRVFVVNRAMARSAFRGTDPIGHHIAVSDGPEGVIVGVVGDVKQMGLDAEEVPAFYQPLAQKEFDFLRWTTLVVRAEGMAGLGNAIRREVLALDASQPTYDIISIDSLLREQTARPRTTAWIVAALALAGLSIALIGVAGVMAYAVTLRTRELGVRMALGAKPRQVLALVLRNAAALAAAGVALGLFASSSFAPLLDRLLFRVDARDAIVYGSVPLAMVAFALAAALVPARRAAAIDPASTLRAE